MAQVILSSVGQAIGGAVGGLAGRLVGAGIDRTLLNGLSPARQAGPRLTGLQLSGSAQGDPVRQVFGRARVAGTVIWAARLKENRSTTRASKTSARTESFSYSLSFALGLCEGPVDGIGRIWADGQLLDRSQIACRLYQGSEDQGPDGLIAAIEGTAPGYRGLAYLVFEDLDIGAFGNRPPNLSVEVFRRPKGDATDLESRVTGVCLIPGAGEFIYATSAVSALSGLTKAVTETQHTGDGRADFVVALDQLEAQLPNVRQVNLVVSWFGTSLDAGACEIRPGVETADKATTPVTWSVDGLMRGEAHVVSRVAGRPAYGGTPCDAVVVSAIRELKQRGYAVTLVPFLLMDTDGYPWRGRITSAGDAASDVAAFMDREWGFRRFVKHVASLGATAGGVEAIVMGSELRGLTTLRSGPGVYPMVAALRGLAAEVRAILPEARISYGADWSEYFGHHADDGVWFHLDPLWSDGNIDFIGIDWYAPLTDWRDGEAHLDRGLAESIYDPDYLKSRIRGGEGFDWYYASDGDREAQARTAIIDTAYGEDWVFRPKDVLGWWSSPHHDRPGGVRAASATAWVPGSKPVRFIEIGCAAIDKGPNAPNRFLDPKSSESAVPYFSSGERDDRAQRAYLTAFYDYYNDTSNNPGMVTDMAVWCWDARPYPWFPQTSDVWGDTASWRTGHWLNGRVGTGEAANLIVEIAGQAGIAAETLDLSEVSGTVDGYVMEQPMAAGDALSPVLAYLGLEVAERGPGLSFIGAGHGVDAEVAAGDLAYHDRSPVMARRDLVEVPASLTLRCYDADHDDQIQMVTIRRDDVGGGSQVSIEAPLVLTQAQAIDYAGYVLGQAQGVRGTVTVDVDPLLVLRVETGDGVRFGGVDYRVTEVDQGERPAMTLEPAPRLRGLVAADPSQAGGGGTAVRQPVMTGFTLMELPCFGLDETNVKPVLVASADPWAGVDVYAGGSAVSLRLRGRVAQAAGIGRTLSALPVQRRHYLLRAAFIDIYLEGEAPVSCSEEELLAGANLACVRALNEEWELIQFVTATALGRGMFRLGGLVRGQWGSEQALLAGIGEGAEVVMLASEVARADIGSDELGLDRLWRCGRTGFGGVADGALDSHAAWTGLALRPRAPVHVAVTGVGDVTVSWLRSPRYGGDSWDVEPPLCEDYELYRVTVYDGEMVRRTVEVAASPWVYAVADRAVDFPDGFGAGSRVEIAQASQVYGWGPGSSVGLG